MEKLIGLGAAGNKAVIEAIRNGYPREDCLLINSTLKDIEEEFHDISADIGGIRGGCGKERSVAKNITIASLTTDDSLKVLDELPDEEDETIHLVTSTEGGTGSGSTPLIAKYLHNVHGLNVIITAFTGFEDDARGLSNTVEFFKELENDYVVQIISNKKALDGGTNKMKAQQIANNEFVKRLEVLTARNVVDSHNNIDDTDLFKVISTPGYMTVEFTNIAGLKNVEQFNSLTSDMIDSTLSVDFYDPQSQRIAVYMDIEERSIDAIDFNYDVIKEKLGEPFEIFNHIQHTKPDEEYIAVIASGMNMPIEEVQSIHDEYMRRLEEINKKEDNFFDEINQMSDDNSSNRFDTAKRRTDRMDRTGFLESIALDEEEISIKDSLGGKKKEFLEDIQDKQQGDNEDNIV